MEKLGQLRAPRPRTDAAAWDLIVVDTPPSRSALDFLDAPKRLGSFLDGRFIRLLARAGQGRRPGLPEGRRRRGSARSPASCPSCSAARLLHDLQTFVAALDTMFGGFRERADADLRSCCRRRGTAFLVVAAPEPDALREASYFVERLAEDGMPLAGLVLNRVHAQPARRRCRADAQLGAAEHARRVRAASAADRGAAAAARGADAAGRPRASTWLRAFTAAFPDVPVARGRGAGLATCTTWTGCARSATPDSAGRGRLTAP